MPTPRQAAPLSEEDEVDGRSELRAPLGAMTLVSELAGSYDLLVPLMPGTVGAHVLLRKVQLYGAQLPSRRAATVPGATAI